MAGERETGGGLYLAPALYDVVNTPGTAAEVDALERVARRYGPSPHGDGRWRWLEPACGTARYLRVLRGRGHHVAGYDALPDMLAYARRRLARWSDGWTLVESKFTTPASSLADLGPADIAICPVNSLRHLPNDGAVRAHLAQVRALLREGGIYIVGLDLLRPDVAADEDVWEGARGRLHVREVVQYLPPTDGGRRERVVVQMMATRPRGVAHHGWAYDLRTYTETQWTRLLRATGWRRLAVCDGDGAPAPPGTPLSYQLEVLG